MTNPTLDLITEYNTKALETLSTLNDLNVATIDTFVNKQVALTSSLFDKGLATSKELAAVKTPAEAVEISSNLFKSVAETFTGFVTESTENSLQVREELKAVVEDSYALNKEYASKALKTGVATAKKTAKKAAK